MKNFFFYIGEEKGTEKKEESKGREGEKRNYNKVDCKITVKQVWLLGKSKKAAFYHMPYLRMTFHPILCCVYILCSTSMKVGTLPFTNQRGGHIQNTGFPNSANPHVKWQSTRVPRCHTHSYIIRFCKVIYSFMIERHR